MKNILIFGYYGEKNLGDELILENLRDCFEKRFNLGVLTSNKDYYKNLITFQKFKPLELFKGINWADIIIGGGGGIFQDKTSLRSLIYYLSILWLSFLKGKKIYLLGQSFSPFRYAISKYLVKISLLLCEKIYLRDSFSFKYLINIGVPREKLYIIPDIAFLSKFEKRSVNKNYVGVNFRPWKGTNINDLENILKNLKKNERVIFFSFQDSLDLKFFNSLSQEAKKGIDVVPYCDENFVDKFSSCKYFIGMRLHSLILASIFYIPFLAISYDEKIEAYLEDLGWKFYLKINDLDRFLPLWIQLKEEDGLDLYLRYKVEDKKKSLKEELEKLMSQI
ncbi:MAG: polysaccharide pyruvyl transferase CsaB [Dictyoglomaceae bacterium]